MSDLFATSLFVFAIYCAWAIAVYKPRPATIQPESQPIQYFPEVEDTEEETAPESAPIVIVEPLPVAAFKAPTKTKKAIANLIVEEATKADIVRPNYDAMGVRELYKIASAQGIKGYKKLSKANLIALLQ